MTMALLPCRDKLGHEKGPPGISPGRHEIEPSGSEIAEQLRESRADRLIRRHRLLRKWRRPARRVMRLRLQQGCDRLREAVRVKIGRVIGQVFRVRQTAILGDQSRNQPPPKPVSFRLQLRRSLTPRLSLSTKLFDILTRKHFRRSGGLNRLHRTIIRIRHPEPPSPRHQTSPEHGPSPPPDQHPTRAASTPHPPTPPTNEAQQTPTSY